MGLGEGATNMPFTVPVLARAREALERSQYAGPAPVPLKVYYEGCQKQARGHMTVNNTLLRQVLAQLVCLKNLSKNWPGD